MVKDDKVATVLLLDVVVNSDNFTFEVHLLTVFIVEVHGFRQMDRVVKNLLGGFGDTLLSSGDLVVKIAGNRLLRNFRHFVGTDAP